MTAVASNGPTSFGTSYGSCGPSTGDLFPIYQPQSSNTSGFNVDDFISTIRECRTDLSQMSHSQREGARLGLDRAYRKTFGGHSHQSLTGVTGTYDSRTKSEWEETFTQLGGRLGYREGDLGSVMTKQAMDDALTDLFSDYGGNTTGASGGSSNVPTSGVPSGTVDTRWDTIRPFTEPLSRPPVYRGIDRTSRIAAARLAPWSRLPTSYAAATSQLFPSASRQPTPWNINRHPAFVTDSEKLWGRPSVYSPSAGQLLLSAAPTSAVTLPTIFGGKTIPTTAPSTLPAYTAPSFTAQSGQGVVSFLDLHRYPSQATSFNGTRFDPQPSIGNTLAQPTQTLGQPRVITFTNADQFSHPVTVSPSVDYSRASQPISVGPSTNNSLPIQSTNPTATSPSPQSTLKPLRSALKGSTKTISVPDTSAASKSRPGAPMLMLKRTEEKLTEMEPAEGPAIIPIRTSASHKPGARVKKSVAFGPTIETQPYATDADWGLL